MSITIYQNIKITGKLFLICIGFIFLSSSFVLADDQTVKKGDTVAIHYTGKLEDGKVFDTSEGRDSLKFQVGQPGIIQGMNDGVIGMKVGETKTLNIPPKKGYGEWTEKMTASVPLKNLPAGIKSGERLKSTQGHLVVVKEIIGDYALLDGNHFLAGKTLIFDIKLVAIN